MELLKPMLQHWPVDFVQNVTLNLDSVIGRYPKDIRIEGGMVNLAERKSIRNNGFATYFSVADDVRSI